MFIFIKNHNAHKNILQFWKSHICWYIGRSNIVINIFYICLWKPSIILEMSTFVLKNVVCLLKLWFPSGGSAVSIELLRSITIFVLAFICKVAIWLMFSFMSSEYGLPSSLPSNSSSLWSSMFAYVPLIICTMTTTILKVLLRK